MYAAELVCDLRGKLGAEAPQFFGCGGKKMRGAGVETLVDIHSLAVLGPFEAVSHLFHLYSALRLLVQSAAIRRPAFAILVDFPDFNLRLARKAESYRDSRRLSHQPAGLGLAQRTGGTDEIHH